jgi:hypothetical protein
LLVDATIAIGRGCGVLAALLAPLLATLLGIPDDDIGRCFPVFTWGWVKLSRLVPDGVLGGDAVQLLGGVLDGVGRFLKRL